MSTSAVIIVGKIFEVALPEALRNLLKRRADTAKDILLTALQNGDATLVDVSDVDEFAAMVFEFMTAAQRGTARLNLQLLAQVFAGLVVSKPIYADDFLRWSADLASLTREEVFALGVLYKSDIKANTQSFKEGHERINFINTETRSELIGTGKLCATEEEFSALFGALVRTGLVVLWPGFDNLVYSSSEKLRRLMKIADVNGVVNDC